MIGDSQFILRLIPSGILHPTTTCVLGNGVVIDPESFLSELDGLAERGIDVDAIAQAAGAEARS
mgnify:CR=1 FL=1